jgi:dienelactone hydrolase
VEAALKKLFCAAALFIVFLFAAGIAYAQPKETGVVVMHGKWGGIDKYITPIAGALGGAGYRVANIEMPWSKARMYDVDYGAAMKEIDAAVAKLKADGAKRIVVLGHSLGANAALGYAATRDGLSGVIGLAPGHSPERFQKLASSVAKAKAIVAEGKGDSTANFEDINGGQTRNVSVRARIYVSYFDPAGPAVMPNNAARLKAPLL